jgi:hypothetical protein
MNPLLEAKEGVHLAINFTARDPRFVDVWKFTVENKHRKHIICTSSRSTSTLLLELLVKDFHRDKVIESDSSSFARHLKGFEQGEIDVLIVNYHVAMLGWATNREDACISCTHELPEAHAIQLAYRARHPTATCFIFCHESKP